MLPTTNMLNHSWDYLKEIHWTYIIRKKIPDTLGVLFTGIDGFNRNGDRW
jgi:hypothetical protein